MLRSTLGGLLSLALVSLSSCRTDNPPQIEICEHDGFGGADCNLPTDPPTRVYRAPSELNTYWMTNQEDFARFAAWCYDTDIKQVKAEMAKEFAPRE